MRIDGHFTAKDYTNKKIGLLTPIRPTKKRNKGDGAIIWRVKCECGKILNLPSSRFAVIYSCGCKQRFNAGRKTPLDLSNYKNKMATAIQPTDQRSKGGYVIWIMKCDCGKTFERPAYDLTRKTVTSCGCTKWMPKGRPRIKDGGAYINSCFRHHKNSAKIRKLAFTLSLDEVKELITKPCFYCGEIPKTKKVRNLSGTFAYHGIDRIDSKIGYITGNCRPCCKHCNWAKRTLTSDEFKNLISNIYHNFCV